MKLVLGKTKNRAQNRNYAMAGVAQGIECQPVNQKVPGVRAQAWVVGHASNWGRARGNQLIYLSHIGVSPSFFSLPSPL